MEKQVVDMGELVSGLMDMELDVNSIKVATILAIAISRMGELGCTLGLSSNKPIMSEEDALESDITLLDTNTGERYDVRVMLYCLSKALGQKSVENMVVPSDMVQ